MSVPEEEKAVYFGSLTVEGVKCFEGEAVLKLTTSEGKPSLMNVILGNNGMGKTTLLTCLNGMVMERVTNPNPDEGQAAIAAPLRLLHDFPRFSGRTACSYLSLEGKTVDSGSGGSHFVELTKGQADAKVRFLNVWQIFSEFRAWGYNANRFVSRRKTEIPTTHYSFFHDGGMVDVEKYLLDLDYGREKGNEKSRHHFFLIENAIKRIVPNALGLNGKADPKNGNFIEVEIPGARIPFYNLSLGYQVMLTMTIDICRTLIAQYPENEDPFNEPAVVLIDEIDLHLHPTWQQRILKDLRESFPNVQFIVTTHSPLVVQNASDFNLAILEGGEGGVRIRNLQGANLQGWTVEEILENVMGVKDASSQEYLNASNDFERAINNRDFDTAQKAYERLKGMLPKDSVKAEIMQLRMAGLSSKKAV